MESGSTVEKEERWSLLRDFLQKGQQAGIDLLLDAGLSSPPELPPDPADPEGDSESLRERESLESYLQLLHQNTGEFVSDYLTCRSLNEPLLNFFSETVTGKRGLSKDPDYASALGRVLKRFLFHFTGYSRLHELARESGRPEPRVSAELHVDLFIPGRASSTYDMSRVRFLQERINRLPLEILLDGRLNFPFGNGEKKGTTPSLDFLTLRYTGYHTVRFRLLDRKKFFLTLQKKHTGGEGLERLLSGLPLPSEIPVHLVCDFSPGTGFPLQIDPGGISIAEGWNPAPLFPETGEEKSEVPRMEAK